MTKRGELRRPNDTAIADVDEFVVNVKREGKADHDTVKWLEREYKEKLRRGGKQIENDEVPRGRVVRP